MTPQQILPEYWHPNRRPRQAPDYRTILTIVALALASAALIFAGAMAAGFGSATLGHWMMGAGAVFFVAASLVGDRRA